MSQCSTIQRSLVAERVVEAGASNPHLFGKIPHRGRFKTLRPEAVHRRFQNGDLVELSWSVPSNASHAPPATPAGIGCLINCVLERLGQNSKTT
jgi:hypothetical protein